MMAKIIAVITLLSLGILVECKVTPLSISKVTPLSVVSTTEGPNDSKGSQAELKPFYHVMDYPPNIFIDGVPLKEAMGQFGLVNYKAITDPVSGQKMLQIYIEPEKEVPVEKMETVTPRPDEDKQIGEFYSYRDLLSVTEEYLQLKHKNDTVVLLLLMLLAATFVQVFYLIKLFLRLTERQNKK